MNSAIAKQPAPSDNVSGFLGRRKQLLIGGEWSNSASSVEIPV